tara:strand:+ start:3112 stop:3300 length:189 start_codon:yes stop_codon:yes gene_type:complete
MGDNDLSLFASSQLKYLRQQVDRLQDEQYRRDALPNTKRDLFAAREELDNFVKELRKAGHKI